MARLEVLEGIAAGTSFSLGEEVSLGRGPENTIPLSDDLISRHHVCIRRQGPRFVIEDLDSTNGTRLRGKRLVPRTPIPLVDGDEVQIGATRLRFHVESDRDFQSGESAGLAEQGTESLEHHTALPHGADREELLLLIMPDNLPPSATVIALDTSKIITEMRQIEDAPEQGLQEVLKRLQIMYQLSTMLGAITDRDVLMQKTLEAVFERFPAAEGAYIVLQTKDKDGLVPMATRNRSQGVAASGQVVLPQTIVDQVMSYRRSILVTEPMHDRIADDGEKKEDASGTFAVRSVMCVPLLVEGDLLGLMQVDACANRSVFTSEDLQTLTGIGVEAATAIKKAQVYEEYALANRELQENITRRLQVEQQLRHDALHDVLTGLPNRALFLDRLGRVIERARRNSGYRFAVLFLDLDHFKRVNDSFGHAVGDRLLSEIAKRISYCLRRSDTVARLGGDEFAILLDDVTSERLPLRAVERIQRALRQPFVTDGKETRSTASIGVALSTIDFKRPEELLSAADTAMYWAKEQGGGRYAVFSARMQHRVLERVHLESELRRALEQHELEVYYQPIINLATGVLAGFEALARWQHPERGLVMPATFIPVAEETGLIVHLDREILQQACYQLCLWQRQFPDQCPAFISVNMSGKQFRHHQLLEQVTRVLNDTDLESRYLKLEITESALIDNVDVAATLMTKLRDMGVQLGIDDFGTGYSSLGFLQRFPLDVLKIDRSFVSQIGGQGEHEEVLRAIVGLAHALNMDVVAEGIETTAQLNFLKTLGCAYGQGFLFARPLPGEGATALIAEGKQW
jgi:diguanylate cyclase (GGDEF)-like protein